MKISMCGKLVENLRALLLAVTLGGVLALPASAASTAGEPLSTEAQTTSIIPYKQEPALSKDLLTRVAIVFLVAVILLLVAMVLLRKFGVGQKMTSRGRSQLLEVKRLTPKTTSMLVRVDSVEYLIVQGDQAVSVVRHENNMEMKDEP